MIHIIPVSQPDLEDLEELNDFLRVLNQDPKSNCDPKSKGKKLSPLQAAIQQQKEGQQRCTTNRKILPPQSFAQTESSLSAQEESERPSPSILEI